MIKKILVIWIQDPHHYQHRKCVDSCALGMPLAYFIFIPLEKNKF